MPDGSANNGSAKFGGIKGYFLSVFDGVFTTLRGMQVTQKYWNIVRERPITLQYPDQRPDVRPGYRGKHVYVKAKCISCRMCMRVCPVNCIEMDIEGKGKDAIVHSYKIYAIVHSYKIDFTRCMFCNSCSEICPTDCLWLSDEFDLSQYARTACKMELLDESNAELEMPEGARVVKPPKPPKPVAKPKKTEEPTEDAPPDAQA